ncbi:MAG TPA: hypothetical protein VMW87_10190 [Spirochaetia bacterium]|nr:hypothetical protein [Spirochaetia bacterium]
MRQSLQWVFYGLLCVLMLATFYAILNAGSPHSLLRYIVRDPAYDVSIALGLGIVVGAIAITLYTVRRESPLKTMLESNVEYIHKLRRKGKSEEDIALSFLNEIGSRRGPLHLIAKRRVLKHLSRL